MFHEFDMFTVFTLISAFSLMGLVLAYMAAHFAVAVVKEVASLFITTKPAPEEDDRDLLVILEEIDANRKPS